MPGKPCSCWSCDGMCGGSQDAGWCGPLAPDADGNLICEVCRGKADVFGADRAGTQVSLNQDRVCVAVDVFSWPARTWLTAASARRLAEMLTERAAELEAHRA
jgi:hypothetical protein